MWWAVPDVEVFPKHELLGWYSTGAQIEAGDVELHRSVRAPVFYGVGKSVDRNCLSQVSEDGLWYLFLNTAGTASDKELPISIHALETHLVDGVPRTEFCQHKLSVATSEMERLTLDHVSSVHSAADTESACMWGSCLVVFDVMKIWVPLCFVVKRQLGNAVTAVESLSDRIGIIVQYLRHVQSGSPLR